MFPKSIAWMRGLILSTPEPVPSLVRSDSYTGPDRRVPESMGIVGNARQLSNVAAVALVAAICVALLTVMIAVMWFALRDADARATALFQAQERNQEQMGRLMEAQQRREDQIREQESMRFSSLMSRLDAQNQAIGALTSEVRGLTSEVRASRVQIETTGAAIKEKKNGGGSDR